MRHAKAKCATFCKVLQKQTYDILSQKYGLLTIIICFFVFFVSVLQFGEALLEWSHEKYSAVFNSYSDNIAGKSFRTRLCSSLPIDVVYTWVNGSDPLLLEQLQKYRLQDGNVVETKPFVCKLKHCLRMNWFSITPTLKNTSLFYIRRSHPLLKTASRIFLLNGANSTIIETADYDAANTETTLFSLNNQDYVIKPCYVTTDYSAPNSHMLRKVVIVTGIPQSLTARALSRNVLKSVRKDVERIVMFDYSAVVLFKGRKDYAYKLEDENLTISGKLNLLRFYSANIVWDFSANTSDDISAPNRFEDNEELRYSLRSLYRFAPWIRRIFIVTNGQIPSWLNLDHPRITLISHRDIFVNESHLPTFSSPAIESHLHRIPGLSEFFLYFNDDVMLGGEVWPEDFTTHARGQKLYLTWPVPNCRDGCPASWIQDGYCDRACNHSACDWDGGDCDAENAHARTDNSPFIAQRDDKKQYCATGCADNWLADGYCDLSCNNGECGYDAGDCGIDKLRLLPSIQLAPNNRNYSLTAAGPAFIFNVSLLLLNQNSAIHNASYDNELSIRTCAVIKDYDLFACVLRTRHNLTQFEVDIVITEAYNVSAKHVFTIHLLPGPKDIAVPFNFTAFIAAARKRNATKEDNFQNIPFSLRSPQLIDLDKDAFKQTSFNDDKALKILQELYDNGELTLAGLEREKAAILKHKNSLSNSNSSPKNASFLGAQLRKNRKLLWKTDDQIIEHDFSLLFSNIRSGFLPWEKKLTFKENTDDVTNTVFHSRRLLDTFSDSLRHVNTLYSRNYGYTSRKIPAHMPHYINKDIVIKMQERFPVEFDVTSSHRFCRGNDMQFSFSYYYFLASEKENVTLDAIFEEVDFDNSGVLSDREIRVLAAKIFTLPLDILSLNEVEQLFINCSKDNVNKDIGALKQEKYYTNEMPQITKELFLNCFGLQKLVGSAYKPRNRYKHEFVTDKDVAFKMIGSNVSIVISQLDEIRKSLPKFVCLNDDIDHRNADAFTVKAVLLDFYETFFPKPSPFELPPHFRNRFLHLNDLRAWKREKRMVTWASYLGFLLLFALCLKVFFPSLYGKIAKSVSC